MMGGRGTYEQTGILDTEFNRLVKSLKTKIPHNTRTGGRDLRETSGNNLIKIFSKFLRFIVDVHIQQSRQRYI